MTWTEMYVKSSTLLLPIIAATFVTSAYAVSRYDSDGFTIFPTKSGDYMVGYRAGVVQASHDVDAMNNGTKNGVDVHQDHIVCPSNFNAFPGMCQGYKDGYADEAMDQLE
jgi:hypothetical protein